MLDHGHRLQPQDAFDELGRITLADHSVESVMDKIAALAKRTLSGVDEVSVTLLENGRARTVAFTGVIAIDLDERQYERGYGPCLDSIDGGEPVRIDATSSESRWPEWAREARRHGVRSSLSVPVPMQREVTAALNVYSLSEHAFDDEAVDLATTFAGYAGVALANIHLYEAQGNVAAQLQAAMHSRAVIEQAKGILMGQRHCSAQEAFDLLVLLSQNPSRKLRDVAQELVDDARAAPG